SVKASEGIFRISSDNGPRTIVALLDAVHAAKVVIASLSVQSTTLDDVFVHYTGRQLRDAEQKANPAESQFIIRRESGQHACIGCSPSSNAISGASKRTRRSCSCR